MADLKLGNIKPVGADNIVVEGKYVKGGYVVVADIEERNALKGTSGENIIEGSLCYCQADKKFYQYNGTAWEEKKYVEEHQNISHLATKEEIPSLEGYAKENYVDEAIANIKFPETDLSNYYNKEEVNALIPDVSDFITNIPEEYITETELNAKGYLTEHQSLEHLALKEHEHNQYLTEHQSLKGYATESYVDNAIDAIPEVDLTDYAKKTDLFSKSYNDLTDKPEIPSLDGYAKTADIPDVSKFIKEIPAEYITEEELNEKGYLTEHQSLENYYTKTEVEALLPEKVELLDTNVTLSTELKTYYNVGKITNASGTNPVPIGKAGDTLRDVLNNLFSMDEIQPSITQNPSVSCSLSSTKSDERGTDISQVSYSITFNDGAYTNAGSTGVSMTGYSFSSGTASNTTETYGTLTLPTTYTVGTSSAFSTTITANYSDGNVAKTNLGNNSNPVIQITASSCTATPTFSKTAVDYPYYVSSTASSISELSSLTKAKKSTSLVTSAGLLCNYNANAYVWIFIRKGTNTSQPTKTIQAYSDIAKEWGTFLGGTEKIGEITFNKENGKSDTFYAYRTTNVAQAADSATFRLQ